MSNEFSQYLQKYKIRHQLTCPNSPQKNGVAKRKNKHLPEYVIACYMQVICQKIFGLSS